MNSEEQAIVHNLLVPQEGGIPGELLGQLLRGRRVDLQAEVEVVVLQYGPRLVQPDGLRRAPLELVVPGVLLLAVAAGPGMVGAA